MPVESTRSRPTRESELEAYLNQVFDDLLLKDNGRTRQDIEAYYFLRVPLIDYMTLSIVHAPALLPSEEDVRCRLHPPAGGARPLQVRLPLDNESDLPWNLVGAT